MTRADALRALLEKVEAGEASGRFGPLLDGHFDIAVTVDAMRAYNGSLDAAKALHEAVLPGIPVKLTDMSQEYLGAHGWCVAVNWPRSGRQEACLNNPARAWLIAILKALIATEDN